VNGESTAAGFESRVADWLGVDDALRRIVTSASPLGTEVVPLADAVGRALGVDVHARATLPPWDNSAMDGYAVLSSDITGASRLDPVTLRVTGIVRAGGAERTEVEPGTAVRIMTGAPVPPGADTIVRVEDTDAEAEPGRVRIFDERDRRRHVRGAGQDMREGELLLEAGRTVTPGAIGVLASAGLTEVRVHTQPRVGLLATGDELREAGDYADVRDGRGIPESNVPMLSALARAIGAHPVDLGIARDTRVDLETRIRAGSDTDALVTIGGASMGEADLVKRVLDDLGFEQDFWRVRMRPGSPISFGWLVSEGRRQPVFGLPGNPSSAYVTFSLFVRPFLLRLAGHRNVGPRIVSCIAAESFDAPADLTYFQRVTLTRANGVTRASLTGPQGSGLVTGLATAHGLAIVPRDRNGLAEGDPVSVLLLDSGHGTEDSLVG